MPQQAEDVRSDSEKTLGNLTVKCKGAQILDDFGRGQIISSGRRFPKQRLSASTIPQQSLHSDP